MRHSVVRHTMIVAAPCVLNVLVAVSHVSSLCLNQFKVFNSIDPSSVLKGSMAMASRTFGSQRLGAATSILHGIPRRPHHQLGRTTLTWVTGKMQCTRAQSNCTAPHRTRTAGELDCYNDGCNRIHPHAAHCCTLAALHADWIPPHHLSATACRHRSLLAPRQNCGVQ